VRAEPEPAAGRPARGRRGSADLAGGGGDGEGSPRADKLAERTGFSAEDLAFLWDALANMFEHDHSAARGEMAVRGLITFKHASALGNAHAHVCRCLCRGPVVAGDPVARRRRRGRRPSAAPGRGPRGRE